MLRYSMYVRIIVQTEELNCVNNVFSILVVFFFRAEPRIKKLRGINNILFAARQIWRALYTVNATCTYLNTMIGARAHIEQLIRLCYISQIF